MGGPRFPRPESHFGFESPKDTSGESPEAELSDGIPEPIEDRREIKPSSKKKDLEGTTLDPDLRIDFDDPDATERIEALQSSLSTTRPPAEIGAEEITEEDERELAANLKSASAAAEASDRTLFEDEPRYWNKLQYQDHLDELLKFRKVADEKEVSHLLGKMVEEYGRNFRKVSGGKEPDLNTYADKLNRGYREGAAEQDRISEDLAETKRLDIPRTEEDNDDTIETSPL